MIKISLKFKVLLVLLTLTIVLIIGMSLTMQYRIKQGFFNYRKAIDNQFNQSLVNTLENYYEENSNWQGLVENKKLWHELLNESSVETDQNRGFRPPKRRPPEQHNKGFEQRHRPPPHGGVKKRNARGRLLPPIALLNKNKQLIIGLKKWKQKQTKQHEISVDGQIKGYLAIEYNNHNYNRQDKLFVKNIQSMLIKIGLVMIIFASIIALPAQHLRLL